MTLKNPKIIGRSGIIKNETLAKEGIGGKGEGWNNEALEKEEGGEENAVLLNVLYCLVHSEGPGN